MKKQLLLILLIPLMAGCENFLDIRPKSEVLEKEIFSDDEKTEDALYGIYGQLGGNAVFFGGGSGDSFLGVAGDLMSGNTHIVSAAQTGLAHFSHARWNIKQAIDLAEPIWKEYYSVIGHVNNIINHFDEGEVAEMKYGDLYYGEALALRAWLHFNLLQYFAVDISSSNAAAKARAIPYVTRYSFAITPFSSVEDIYGYIIDDLTKAEALTVADEQLLGYPRDNVADGFTSCRILHLNHYAVQAMLARVYFHKGDMINAAKYAKMVIDSEKFPLMTPQEMANYVCGELHLKETVFGVWSEKFTTNCKNYYNPNSNISLLVMASDLALLYGDKGPEPGEDIRFREGVWFYTSSDGYRMSKMVTPERNMVGSDYVGQSIAGANVIRIPEMYYIMAEALLESDRDLATEYIDQVIESRGMVGIADRPEGENMLTAEHIYRERRKEFYGEGMQWFNMKRLRRNIIDTPSGEALDGSKDATYTVPIPISIEMEQRDE
jgi:hypothetical protein